MREIAAACKGSPPCLLGAATSNRQMGAAYIPLPSNCLNATECTMLTICTNSISTSCLCFPILPTPKSSRTQVGQNKLCVQVYFPNVEQGGGKRRWTLLESFAAGRSRGHEGCRAENPLRSCWHLAACNFTSFDTILGFWAFYHS